MRRGLYMVRIDQWYSERVVWAVAGIVEVIGAALALTVHPAFVLLVTGVGLFSIFTGITGYDPIGTLAMAFGAEPRLAPAGPAPRLAGVRLYRMDTASWFLERCIYPFVGVNLTIASILSLVWTPWWLLFPAFVETATVYFAGSGFCIVANALWRLGFEPRLGACRTRAPASAGAAVPASV